MIVLPYTAAAASSATNVNIVSQAADLATESKQDQELGFLDTIAGNTTGLTDVASQTKQDEQTVILETLATEAKQDDTITALGTLATQTTLETVREDTREIAGAVQTLGNLSVFKAPGVTDPASVFVDEISGESVFKENSGTQNGVFVDDSDGESWFRKSYDVLANQIYPELEFIAGTMLANERANAGVTIISGDELTSALAAAAAQAAVRALSNGTPYQLYFQYNGTGISWFLKR